MGSPYAAPPRRLNWNVPENPALTFAPPSIVCVAATSRQMEYPPLSLRRSGRGPGTLHFRMDVSRVMPVPLQFVLPQIVMPVGMRSGE